MVRQSENIKNQLKTINESFPEINITLSGELLKIYSKESDEHRKITQFLKNSNMDFFLITPTMKGPLQQLLKDFPAPPSPLKSNKNFPPLNLLTLITKPKP
ncbi:hypothetical protein CEXT_43391 [Caerostris extrusa]|uniref:Uncharacterized protein n=1 Tax=Caerostris extrusa TaxID=172846 RepID=A0AAV4XCP4_CAEEX|nr:hypothetical protein CEXT_43391 [Caerostris extrusa]